MRRSQFERFRGNAFLGGGVSMDEVKKNRAAVDAYIAACEPKVRKILRKVRATIRKAAPGAQEVISYRMPAFVLDGHLVYVGAFRSHLGLFPPVRDAKLKLACAKFAGPKGNLRFPYDEEIPYALITRIVRRRVKENRARAAALKRSRRRVWP